MVVMGEGEGENGEGQYEGQGQAAPGMAELARDLRALGAQAGLAAVGFAPARPLTRARHDIETRKAAGLHGGMHFTYGNPARSTAPALALPDGDASTLVVAARSYRKAQPVPPAQPGRHGMVARYSWADEYEPLRAALALLADRLRAEGFKAVVLVDDNALVDREAAFQAGLGWYGKNANLLVPGAGSYVVLGSVVTDAPLPTTDPANTPDPAASTAAGCGACTRCLPACPTGALIAPGVLDARRCLAWLLEAPGSFPVEFRAALGGRVYGCDDCQEACPPNRAVDRRDPPPSSAGDDQPFVDLVELLDMSDAHLLRRFERWYVPRRQARYLRRNALVALGNVGDPTDPDVRRVVASAQADPDPIVREHADWAATRLGLTAFSPAPATAPAPAR
ncbi:MAG: epoxyqueuosine reductase [Acidimicrobiaceae bacterium]|nr:epoxyqueuosine reductase [Acidimicrobiaceae bacterium]